MSINGLFDRLRLELAEKINTLAAEVGMDNTWTILNKVMSEEITSKLRDELEKKGISVIGSIGYDPDIFQSGLEGRPLHGNKAGKDIEKVLDQLLCQGDNHVLSYRLY